MKFTASQLRSARHLAVDSPEADHEAFSGEAKKHSSGRNRMARRFPLGECAALDPR